MRVAVYVRVSPNCVFAPVGSGTKRQLLQLESMSATQPTPAVLLETKDKVPFVFQAETDHVRAAILTVGHQHNPSAGGYEWYERLEQGFLFGKGTASIRRKHPPQE